MTHYWPNPVDRTALEFMLSIRSDALTAVVRATTVVGNTVTLILITTVAVAILYRRRHIEWAAFCAVTSLVAWGLMNLAKVLFGRDRPPIPPRLIEIGTASFPSGHALNSAVVFGVIAVAATSLTGRRWPIALAAAGSVVVGLTRVYLAAHWMTDVLAGWLIGAAIVAAALWLRPRMTRAVTPDRGATRGRAARRDRRGGPPAAAG